MPCFFRKVKIKEILDELKIIDTDLLYQEMLKRYSDEQLHEMSEEEIINLINEIWREMKMLFWRLKKAKKKTIDVELMYR
ncbi:MAG: hypothetical protein ACFFA8_15365 [Promethearchaeota archaeon]